MIDFTDMKKCLKAAGFETLRNESDTYFEVVFVKAQLDKYLAELNRIFGKASWPSDKPLTADIKKNIARYGGVMAGQTLYAQKEGSRMVFAMLWPWGDQVHITLKSGVAA